jgi:hypothetical protein
MTLPKDRSRRERLWRRSVPGLPSKCLGFIFCEIFSNLVATGCRRGRTPERPLRQPSKVWLIKPGLSSCLSRPPRTRAVCVGRGRSTHLPVTSACCRVCSEGGESRAGGEAVQELGDQRSQIGIAGCCVPKKVASTVGSGSFPFRYQNEAGAEAGGKDSGGIRCVC